MHAKKTKNNNKQTGYVLDSFASTIIIIVFFYYSFGSTSQQWKDNDVSYPSKVYTNIHDAQKHMNLRQDRSICAQGKCSMKTL